jgi:hypothetical protein
VLVGTQVSQNWHSGCDGLQRYLVWVLPLFAGVAVTGIGGRWRLWAFAVVAALAHVATLEQHQQPERYPGGYLDHTRTAKWVLTHCPRLYWAEQEIFIERTRHGDDWPGTPSDFPLAFVRPDGTVSKMLLAPADVEKTAARFDVDPGYMEQLRSQAARETGLFYAHPPHGAVRAKLPLGYWATDGTVFAVLVDAASVGKVTEQFEVSDPMFLEMLRDRAGREPEPIYVRANPGTVRLKRPGP